MSKAYFSLGNTYCLARGKKDALVMSTGGSGRSTAVNRAVGAESLGAGKKVFVSLEQDGQVWVLDPGKKGKELVWSKSFSLSNRQSFRVNMMDDRPFGVGASFGLSYRVPDTKVTKYLCFGQGAEPLPMLSESPENIMRLTISEIAAGDDSSSDDGGAGAEDARPASPAPAPAASAAEEPPAPAPAEEERAGRYVVQFMDGPLGVKLKRSRLGTLLVQDIVPESQAVGKGIEEGDKFCKIGDKDVGDHPINDDEFNSIVSIIKEHPRPLPITFERPAPALPAAAPTTAAAPLSDTGSPASDGADAAAETEADAPQPTQQEIDDMEALKRLAERLLTGLASRSSVGGGLAGLAAAIGKPRAASLPEPADAAGPAHKEQFVLLKPGRRIVKHGELDVVGRGTLWNAKTSKYIFLLSDVILITTVKGKQFQLESVIYHDACKFDPCPRDVAGTKPDPLRFDIRWPGGTVEIAFKDEVEKETWSRALSDAVCHSVFTGQSSLCFGWRHVFIHGTLHSAILSRDEVAVRSIISACESGVLDIALLDARDEDLFTPLHYACILRQSKIAEMLLNSHVDCTIPDSLGRTAFHWCAAQLDFPTMELLCSRVFDVDITDDNDRTPLYVACVEGRDAQGRTDAKSLVQLIELLTGAGADPNVVDASGLSPLHYVSASLQFDAVDALLKARAKVNAPALNDAAWTPLHYACSCSPLKKALGEGHKTLHPGEPLDDSAHDSDGHEAPESIFVSDVGRTIGKLLERGAWPNIKAGKAKTSALQLLIMADGVGDPLFQLAAELLVTSGARVDEVVGPAGRNDRFLELKDDLQKCHDEYAHRPPIDAISLALCPGAYLPVKNSNHETSNSEVSCGPCGMTFTMLKRKHRCRLCEVTCCDECSKKRISLDSSKEGLRCCDGCFNRAFAEVEQEKKDSFLASFKPIGVVETSVINDKNRKDLFDGASSAGAGGKTGEESRSDPRKKATAASTANVLSEARQNLEERGEKLSQLADKTDKLAAASSDFADMAKQLKKQQQKSSWWG